jgi:hypothetical protein
VAFIIVKQACVSEQCLPQLLVVAVVRATLSGGFCSISSAFLFQRAFSSGGCDSREVIHQNGLLSRSRSACRSYGSPWQAKIRVFCLPLLPTFAQVCLIDRLVASEETKTESRCNAIPSGSVATGFLRFYALLQLGEPTMNAVTITEDKQSELENPMSARHSAYQLAKKRKFGANPFTEAFRAANRDYVQARDASK